MVYRQLDGNIGELKFYGEIQEWWINAADFTRTIEEMDSKFQTILVRAHCYGGNVFEGNVMTNAISRCKAKTILCIDGVSASMMAIVMQAFDEIECAENAFVMVHCPTGFQRGTAKQFLNTAKLLQGMEKNFTKTLTERTGKTEKEIQQWFDGNDYWFSAEQALQEGLITKIGSPVVANVVQIEKPTENGQEQTVFGQFAALLDNDSNQDLKINNNSMKKLLIAQFNLTGVTENSTDIEIQTAITAKLAEKDSGLKAQLDAAVEAFVSGVEAFSAKPFEAKQRESLVAVGKTMGIATLQSMIGVASNAPVAVTKEVPANGVIPVVNVVSLLGSDANSALSAQAKAREAWGYEDWQKNDPKGLANLEDSNRELFTALYTAEFGKAPSFI